MKSEKAIGIIAVVTTVAGAALSVVSALVAGKQQDMKIKKEVGEAVAKLAERES